MVYTIVFSREAKKSIDKLEEIEKRRIKDRINELMADPYKAGNPLKVLLRSGTSGVAELETTAFSTPFLKIKEQSW